MATKKKLQVFVSSTYSDMLEERQAAVEAILQAGHIPAGMELFAAGNQSQLETIYQWIDESDVYLLILGGRYGSLDPATNKSYTQLEYEYAVQKSKPHFAVIIEENFLKTKVEKKGGYDFDEHEHPKELRAFRNSVTGSKIVKFFNDLSQIQLSIFQTLSIFEKDDSIIGWIPGDQGYGSAIVAEELARLGRENEKLRSQILETNQKATPFEGLSYEELVTVLENEKCSIDDNMKRNFNSDIYEAFSSKLEEYRKLLNHEFQNLLHLFIVSDLTSEQNFTRIYRPALTKISYYGLINLNLGTGLFEYTTIGRFFSAKLRIRYNFIF